MDGYAVRAVETRVRLLKARLFKSRRFFSGRIMFYCNQTNNCAIKITTGAFLSTDFDVVPRMDGFWAAMLKFSLCHAGKNYGIGEDVAFQQKIFLAKHQQINSRRLVCCT